jgi:hypothetical protein
VKPDAGVAWLAVDPPPPRHTTPCQILNERLAVVGELLADGRLHRVPSGRLVVTIARPGTEAIDRAVELEPGARYLLRFSAAHEEAKASASRAEDIQVRLLHQVGLGRYEPYSTIAVPRDARATAVDVRLAVPRRAILVGAFTGTGSDVVSVSVPPARQARGMPLNRLLRIGLTGDAVAPTVLAGDDDLLRAMSFLQGGQLREGRELIEPFVWASERGVTQDPIDAVVAGYILLATHELGPKAEWCAELPVTDPWLPDGFVIAAEWFAAGGFHLTAARHLAQLTEVGMPLFTYGYTRAVSRLRLYAFEPTST